MNWRNISININLKKFYFKKTNLEITVNLKAPNMQKLECAVKYNEWGKLANESIVAKIKGFNAIENDKPFAEV